MSCAPLSSAPLPAAPAGPSPQAALPLPGWLPPVRGDVRIGQPLAKYTWFRVGGPAALLFRPADEDDLATFLAALPPEIPLLVIGVGSNLLIRDGGFPGVVIRLGSAFAGVEVSGTTLTAGAAALDMKVSQAACDAGLEGLEFLSGIPGTIGGAVKMNAGAYSQEISNVLMQICALDRTGKRHTLCKRELGLSYRHSQLPEGWIIISAVLQGRQADQEQIASRMAVIRQSREESQPVRMRTGGSTFANPAEGRAWELIDRAGCRGLRLGGAQVSEKHCNFLLNTGEATASDLETLGETVRQRVRDSSGVELRWEIQRLGLPAPEAPLAMPASPAPASTDGQAAAPGSATPGPVTPGEAKPGQNVPPV